ncbi:MAG: LysR family transcriptional regulator [Vicinamibacterales bacterium]
MESRDLTLLLTLDALLQEENVTLAARRLGLSTPAASHALARIRERLADPILVRAGRRMVLTPRAEALRPLVRNLVEDATRVLSSAVPFSPASLKRTFTIFTTDHVLLVLGPALERIVRAEAPDVTLRFLPSVTDDWMPLRDGVADLSVCILGHFPSEFRTRRLFTDRFVCVVRADHPHVGRRLTLDQFLALEHIVVAPLGRQSHVDEVLAAQGRAARGGAGRGGAARRGTAPGGAVRGGLARRIRRVVPYFLSGLLMAAESDYILTVSERAARALAGRLPLRLIAPPLPLSPYALHLLWHPRLENEPANAWLRDVFLRAAQEAAPDTPAPERRPAAPRKARRVDR